MDSGRHVLRAEMSSTGSVTQAVRLETGLERPVVLCQKLTSQCWTRWQSSVTVILPIALETISSLPCGVQASSVDQMLRLLSGAGAGSGIGTSLQTTYIQDL